MIKKITLLFSKMKLLLFPDEKTRILIVFSFLLFFFNIFLFNYSWCSISTFRPFSLPETYIFGVLFTLILVFQVLVFRSSWMIWVISVLLWALLLSNLIYFRTYNTAIPLSSYALFWNMKDFTDRKSTRLNSSH